MKQLSFLYYFVDYKAQFYFVDVFDLLQNVPDKSGSVATVTVL